MAETLKTTGSHEAASRYLAVPASVDTRGNNYVLPALPDENDSTLADARVLILCADGPELPEIDYPLQFLAKHGARVKIAGQWWIFPYRQPAGTIVIAQWLADAICLKADLSMRDVRVADYDAVYIPGGAWNPDMLRGDDDALRITREAHQQGLLVASICHGPQVLISAAFDAPAGQRNFPAAGVNITGVNTIRRDLRNAGFVVHEDKPTVYDETARLLTARDPNDLGAFCQVFFDLLVRRLASKQ